MKVTRFSDSMWYGENMPEITVGGMGTIGSWLSFFLTRASFPLVIYDFDSVDITNVEGGQLYPRNAIGKLKTEAFLDMSIVYSGFTEIEVCSEFTTDSMISDVCVAGFDNMRARKLMWEAWKANDNRELFIDGRLSAENFQIYVVKRDDDYTKYEATLFEDNEVEELPCSYKATSHCGAMIGSYITGIITNWLTNYRIGDEISEVPFNINMQVPIMKYECL